jgi:hypothetical protein
MGWSYVCSLEIGLHLAAIQFVKLLQSQLLHEHHHSHPHTHLAKYHLIWKQLQPYASPLIQDGT